VVADLGAESSDDPFAVCVHLWRPGCAGQDVHVLGSKDGVEGGRVLRIAVAEQEAEPVQTFTDIGGEVAGLLGCPVLGGVLGDAGDVQPARGVLEEDQGVEAFAEGGVDVEEVRGDDAAGLVGQELFPGGAGSAWGGIDARRVQNFPAG
jgi:hypothetical protein